MHVHDAYQHLSNDEVRAVAALKQLPFAVAIPNVLSVDVNPGTIIRSACAFGASAVFLFGKRRYDRRPTIGTHHYVSVVHYTQDQPDDPFDWEFMMRTIRLNDYTPVIIEKGGPALTQFSPTTTDPVCLVVGAECLAVPRDVCQQERWYSIPTPGVGLTVSAATTASIAMHHVVTHLHTSN